MKTNQIYKFIISEKLELIKENKFRSVLIALSSKSIQIRGKYFFPKGGKCRVNLTMIKKYILIRFSNSS